MNQITALRPYLESVILARIFRQSVEERQVAHAGFHNLAYTVVPAQLHPRDLFNRGDYPGVVGCLQDVIGVAVRVGLEDVVG